MTGSFYRRGWHRGSELEGGGAADLHTDVMRFMAILALCLVVIFALVQSIPLAPVQTETKTPEAAPEPVPETIAPVSATPTPEPVMEPEPPAEATPVQSTPVVVESPPPPAEPEGFTLRFESDSALKRLVARNAIGLYAIGADRALRMNYSRDRISFWEASTPNQFHEMERTTVPVDVLQAMLRTNDVDASAMKWGVTLPADMQADLSTHLATETGGALVIGVDGKLRLEK
jgi:hypothetical protein